MLGNFPWAGLGMTSPCSGSMRKVLRRLNDLLKTHPAFQGDTKLDMIQHQTMAVESSIEQANGSHFALFVPVDQPASAQSCELKLSLFTPDGSRHAEAHLLRLSHPADVRIQLAYRQITLQRENQTYLATNGRGAMLRLPIAREKLNSRYDCLLAANMNRHFPTESSPAHRTASGNLHLGNLTFSWDR